MLCGAEWLILYLYKSFDYMVDVHTSQQRSYNMSRIKSKNTRPELIIKDSLEKRGFLYQLDIYGKPDFINFNKKLVIFIDGCFWHKCPRCFKLPKTNRKFWKDKIKENARRDKEITLNYKNSGWKVLRFWEHEIKNQEIYKLKFA